MDKIKRSVLKNITIDQMRKLNIVTTILGPVILLSNSATTLTGNMMLELFLPAFLINQGVNFITNSKYDHLTKDNYKIHDIYREVLNNYNDLNKSFDFSNPVEMSILLNYAIYKGYLSKDKIFTFGGDNVNDTFGIKGANILSGNATCRHISKFYKDVLDLNNIHNDLIFVSRDESNDIKRVKDAFEKTDEDKLTSTELEEFNLKLQKLEEENDFRLNNPTHCINFVYDNKKSIFIDPTNESLLYTFNEDKETLSYEHYDNVKIFCDKSKSNSSDKLRRYNKYKYLPGMSDEEYKDLKIKTISYIDDGIDVLEKFYKENNEAYNEVYNLIKK